MALKKLFLKVIDVIIRVVANHKGFMAFRLCPNNNPTKAPPAECFSQHPLKLANGETFYFLEPQSFSYALEDFKRFYGFTKSFKLLQKYSRPISMNFLKRYCYLSYAQVKSIFYYASFHCIWCYQT